MTQGDETKPVPGPFAEVGINHVEWYVTNASDRAKEHVERYGFQWIAVRGARTGGSYSALLRQGDIVLVITEPISDDHPGVSYLQEHGDGVADIAFRVVDAAAAFAAAVAAGAVPVSSPVEVAPGWVTASVGGFGDVVHTLVQPPAGATDVVPGFTALDVPLTGAPQGLQELDHFAVSLPSGDLTPTASFYGRVFGFRKVFEERIEVGMQAMDSIVVQSPNKDVTLVLVEPDETTEAGQLRDFLQAHGGSGVQHLALTTSDIVGTVARLETCGIAFLDTPASYYELLESRLQPRQHGIEDLQRLNILVDEDHDGQLFQIFARSTHPRRTCFFEIIQRVGATTFGSGNIKALYEAVENTRIQEATR